MARRKTAGVLGDPTPIEEELEAVAKAQPELDVEIPQVDEPETIPEPEPEPEAEARPAEEEKPEPQEAQRVPLAELLEERKRRQAMEGELGELREKYGRADGRLTQIQEALQARQQQPAQQLPDYEEAPLDHLTARLQQAEQRLQQVDEFFSKQNQYAEQAQQTQSRQAKVAAEEQAFRQTNADYDTAVNYLLTQRDAELRDVFGIEDPVQRHQMIEQDKAAVVETAQRTGRSLPEMVYGYAKSRGYEPASAEANGAGKPTAQPTKLATVREGQQKASTLAGAASQAKAPLTLQSVVDMPDAEFNKVLNNPELFRRLMGD